MRTPVNGTRQIGWLVVAAAVALLVLIAVVILVASEPEPRLDGWDVDSAAVSEDGLTIRIDFSGGACDDHAEARVEESASEVAITVVTKLKRVNGCDDNAVAKTVVAELDVPLGDRTLVDGRCRHRDWGETRGCG